VQVSIAYLTFENQIYFAKGNSETSLNTPVFKLIDGIYFHQPEQARKIIRNRIYHPGDLSISDQETIRVAAKRSTQIDKKPDLTHAIDLSVLNPTPPPTKNDREITCSLQTLDGEILFSALNTNTLIRTRHAEINLILQLKTQKIKGPTVFVSSLKPCAMCAAHLWVNRERLNLQKAIYQKDDPGKLGRDTVLTLGSSARRRYKISNNELISELIVQK